MVLTMALTTSKTLVASSVVIPFVLISIFAWMTKPGLELVRELSFPWYILVPASTIIFATLVHILFIIFFLKNRSLVLQAPSSWVKNLIDSIVFFSVVANDIYDSHSVVYLFISSSTLVYVLSLLSLVKSMKFSLLDLFVSFINPKFLIYFFKKKMIGLLIATGILSSFIICVRNDYEGHLMCYVADITLKEISTTISTKAKNLVTFLPRFMAWNFTREAKDRVLCQDTGGAESADGVMVLFDEAITAGGPICGVTELSTDQLYTTTNPVGLDGYGEAIAGGGLIKGGDSIVMADQAMDRNSVAVLADGDYNREAIAGVGLNFGYSIVMANQAKDQDGVAVRACADYNREAISCGGLKCGGCAAMTDQAMDWDGVAIVADSDYREAIPCGGLKCGYSSVMVDQATACDGDAVLADADYNREILSCGGFKYSGDCTVMADQAMDHHGVAVLDDADNNGEAIAGSCFKMANQTMELSTDQLGVAANLVGVTGYGEANAAVACRDEMTAFADAGYNGEDIAGGGHKSVDCTVTVLVNLPAMESSTDQLDITACPFGVAGNGEAIAAAASTGMV